jgi:hypothetical protein
MSLDQTQNFVRGKVASSISSGDTTINVVDASIYPDPSNGNYNLVIWDAGQFGRPDQDPDAEIFRVTGRDTTGDTLTVSRGQEGTTAVSHPESSELHLSATSKVFTDIDSKLFSSLTISGNDGLSGGSAELNETINIGISGNLSLDSDLVASDGEVIWDEASTHIPNGRLENDEMTIAGNNVALGGSTVINHSNLSNISDDDHHTKYTDTDAIGAINNDNDHGSTASHNYFSGSHSDLSNINSNDHHAKYTDSDAIGAINNDSDHGSTASHNYFSGSHSDLSNINSNDHHTKYSDSDARSAIETGSVSEVAFANIESLNSNRSIGIDDSEGPMYKDHSGNHYSLWNSNYVSGGSNISISGGSGASNGSVTISHSDSSSQGNVATGGATIIDDIDLDGHGHITNINTQNRALDDWNTPTSTVFFDRNGIQSVDSWIEIDGNGSGILMNYKNQGEETRFYGPTNVRNTLTVQGGNGGRLVLPVGTDMFA